MLIVGNVAQRKLDTIAELRMLDWSGLRRCATTLERRARRLVKVLSRPTMCRAASSPTPLIPSPHAPNPRMPPFSPFWVVRTNRVPDVLEHEELSEMTIRLPLKYFAVF